MDRTKFYDLVRVHPFENRLNQSQVDGTNFILDAWDKGGYTDIRHLAYCLATTYWETDRHMQPIEEYGRGQGHSYGRPDPRTGKTYYGRGDVQLTWHDNYLKMGPIVGADLVNHPELALDPAIAAKIMFEGMEHGIFTGKKLDDFFTPTLSDWFHARQIINGLDKASTIAGFACAFHAAIRAAIAPATPVTS